MEGRECLWLSALKMGLVRPMRCLRTQNGSTLHTRTLGWQIMIGGVGRGGRHRLRGAVGGRCVLGATLRRKIGCRVVWETNSIAAPASHGSAIGTHKIPSTICSLEFQL